MTNLDEAAANKPYEMHEFDWERIETAIYRYNDLPLTWKKEYIDALRRLRAQQQTTIDANMVLASINHEVDGLSLSCIRCGQRVPFDCVVDDDFWKNTVCQEWIPDVLCLPCLAKLGGPETHDAIRLIYFSAEGRTSVFVPEATLRAQPTIRDLAEWMAEQTKKDQILVWYLLEENKRLASCYDIPEYETPAPWIVCAAAGDVDEALELLEQEVAKTKAGSPRTCN